MPRFFAFPLLTFAVALSASGAELGEVSVKSHIGQQLAADIELVDLTAADLADVQVRLASADVFKGAGLSINPVLGGLNMSVYKNGPKRFLHLTTLQPVSSDALHIFFEISSGGRQIVRTASLWLTPEPPGAARTTAAAPVPVAAVPAGATGPSGPVNVAVRPTVSIASATNAAGVHAEASPAGGGLVPVPARSSVAPASPTVSAAAVLDAAASKPAATASAAAAPTAAKPAHPVPLAVRTASASTDEETMKTAADRAFAARPKPVAKPVKLAMAPARAAPACSPDAVEASAKQCAAMDASNKELTTKLVDLEGKVKQLQKALADTSAAPGGAGGVTAGTATAATAAGAAAAVAASASAASAPAKASSAAGASATGAAASAREGRVSAKPESAGAAHTASGTITDARAAQMVAPDAGPKPAAEAPKPTAAAKPADKPSARKAKAEEKQKKLSRPKLIGVIAASAVGLLALIGVGVHFGRKFRAKAAARAQAAQDQSPEPVAETAADAPVALAVQE